MIGAKKGLNEPRYASLKGIMAAKKKRLTVRTPADLGVDPASISGDAATVRWTKLELPPARQAVKLIPADDPAKAATELLRLAARRGQGSLRKKKRREDFLRRLRGKDSHVELVLVSHRARRDERGPKVPPSKP